MRACVYTISKWVLTIVFVWLYAVCFRWNPIFGVIMIALFAYCIWPVSTAIVDFIVWLFTKPYVLSELEDVARNGIPADTTVVFFRPIFAKTTQEMDTVFESMQQDIVSSQEPSKSMKFIVIDNTRDENVKSYTRDKIKQMQEKFGADTVFYFHRNVKCDFFKKLGIYEDAILFLYEGWTRPGHYIDSKWKQWAKETRNPELPLWDVIMGNVKSLGIEGSTEDILAGREIKIDKKKRIKLAFVSDADNVWPKGEARKLAAKMLHPDNADSVIWQPAIEISNPNDNYYIWFTNMARKMFCFSALAKWRIYRFSPFYGKGAMRVERYVRDIIKAEALHPGKAASHDFQEALKTWSVTTEDVHILEKTFSNKLSELKRSAQWAWGDLETVRQFIFNKYEPGRRSHLYTLLRGQIGDLIIGLWFIGTVLMWIVPGLVTVTSPQIVYYLLGVILFVMVAIPRFLSPLVQKQNVFTTIYRGIIETVVSVLIHSLDLLYRPQACIKNYINQVRGKPFVWKTGAMAEIETANISLIGAYRLLLLPVVVGTAILIAGIAGVRVLGVDMSLMLFLSPFIASFIFGPGLIWYTTKYAPKR